MVADGDRWRMMVACVGNYWKMVVNGGLWLQMVAEGSWYWLVVADFEKMALPFVKPTHSGKNTFCLPSP